MASAEGDGRNAAKRRAGLRTPRSRPRRGLPQDTRARLVAAAAEEFNRVGYRGTDSNRIARAAGYAPGTFYKHFPDKRAAFLAAYEAWVTAEWSVIEKALGHGGSREQVASRLVDAVLAMHRRWRGLRASLRALIAEDRSARDFYRRQRLRQLKLLAALQARARPREEDAVLLYTFERVSDAVADGELRELGLGVEATVALLRKLVYEHIGR